MRDIERLLTETMQAEGERIDPDTFTARREFLERRRKKRIRFALSGVAVAGAAVAVAVFVASSVPSPITDDDLNLASAVPVVVATAPVTGAPEAAAVVEDGVWIANAEPGRISKIDPETNSVVESVNLALTPEGLPAKMPPGTPDEIVAVGSSIAVSTTGGFIHILDSATGKALDAMGVAGPVSMDIDGPTAAARPSDAFRLDLDVAGETVWVANENNGFIYSLYNAGSGGGDHTGEPVEDIAPNDVAVGGGRVFGLDGHRGKVAVFEIIGEPGPPKLERAGTFDAPSGDFLDMRYGFGKLWISDESGNVYAYDPDSGEELSVTHVGGRYSDLVVDSDSVWALPGGGGDGGRLVAIDPDDGTLRNEGTSIGGNPVDVVSGLGSLWVVDKAGATEDAAGSLLRVDPTGVGTPSPEPENTATDEGEGTEAAQPFFTYSAGGDVFLEMTDGSSKQISMSPDEELNPTFGFGSLIFERHDYETEWSGLVEHDLATGEEQLLGIDGGSHPVLSAGGDLAWVNEDGNTEVWLGFSSGRGRGERVEISLPEGLSDARSLIFSDEADSLLLQAVGEGWVTVQVSLEGDGTSPSSFVLNGVNDQPPGSTFVQPEDPNSEEVTVVDVCCREVEGDPYSQFRIGRLAFTEGGATYESITGPADLADADPGSLTMVSLHGAAQNEDGSWELFADEKGSWLVSDGTSLWFLHTGGGGQMTPDTLEKGELSGFSVNPFLEGHS